MGELIDKAKGKAKQVEGSVTGDRARQAEGVVDEKKGEAKGAFERVKQGLKKEVEKIDPERARQLFDWGVGAVFSDCPDRVAAGIGTPVI